MPSLVEQVTQNDAPGATADRRAVIVYTGSALGVRMLDAGTGIGLLLLAQSRLDPATAARTGGLLVALYTLPHLAGPVLARRLDLASDYRRLLGLAYLVMAAVLAAAALTLGRLPIEVVAVLVVLAGFGGPLLTGGLSSRLADLVPGDDLIQRRVQGLDATIYGVAATAGPAAVAILSGWSTPVTAMLVACALAVVSAVLVQALPRTPVRDVGDVPSVREVLPLVLTNPALRRVNYQTMITAAAQAGLAVIVVSLAHAYQVHPSTAAVLLSVMGAGNLLASLALSARPLTGDPDRLTTRHVAVVGACFGLCAVAPTFWTAIVAFSVMGVATAPFVTATFAARNRYAPPAARGQVFVTLSALKVSAASGGTALTGLLVGVGPVALLLVGGATVTAVAAASILDRHRHPATDG